MVLVSGENTERIKTLKTDSLEDAIVGIPMWACVVLGIIGGLTLGIVFILILR